MDIEVVALLDIAKSLLDGIDFGILLGCYFADVDLGSVSLVCEMAL